MTSPTEVIENIKDFLGESENKKKTGILCGILVFMTLCAVILYAFQSSKKEDKPEEIVQHPLVLDQKLLVPENTFVPDSYITERETPEKWSEEDLKKWFTVPDETELEKLGKANDKIVDEILGAAQ